MESKKLIYETKTGRFMLHKYFAPIIVPMILLCAALIILYVGIFFGGPWYFAGFPLLVGGACAIGLRKDYLYVEHASIYEDGIEFSGNFYEWNKISDLKEPLYLRRIEVYFKDGAPKMMIRIPIFTLKLSNVGWPSEVFNAAQRCWKNSRNG